MLISLRRTCAYVQATLIITKTFMTTSGTEEGHVVETSINSICNRHA